MASNEHEEKLVRVPYHERRTVKKYLIPRLARRRRRKLIRFTLFLCTIILITSVAIVYSSLTENKHAEFQQNQKILPKKVNIGKTANITDTLLFVYSVDKKKISKCAICAFDKETSSLTVITFGENVYYPLLGIGIMNPASLTMEFLDSLYTSVKNSLKYEISGPLKINIGDLDDETLRKSPNRLLDSLTKLNPDIKPNFSFKIKSVEIIPSPTRLTKVGEKTVMVVDQDNLNEAADILFSDKYKKRTAIASVIIINGSGLPGAGSRASIRLVLSGFNVKAVKNAEKFDQLVTEIRTEKEDVGKKIQDVLGCGEVKEIVGGSSVSDAVIILGKDFRGFTN